ncbi:PEP-CTERM sorting domain-containing protein [Duganella guangzhouensis]|nr:PEP-CTERM sorting domain-containing protein [Duganella guangzhouensis]
MKSLPRSLMLCCLWFGSDVGATATAAGKAAPQRTCALTEDRQAQAAGDQPLLTTPGAPTGRKTNFDALFDPCKMDDADKDTDVANNEEESVKPDFSQLDDVIEWNRQRAQETEQALAFGLAYDDEVLMAALRQRQSDGWEHGMWLSAMRRQDDKRSWVEHTTAAPEVPEPSSLLMLLVGLLALAVRGRRQRT